MVRLSSRWCSRFPGFSGQVRQGQGMLDVRDLHKRFGAVKALDGLSLQLQPGRIHALVGPNGCGKTTLLNLISGFYAADQGQILLMEKPPVAIDHLPPSARARLGIGRMFQEPRGIPEFTVSKHVTLCTLGAGSDSVLHAGLRSFRLDGHSVNVKELMELGGLQPAAHCLVCSLSYGQRRVLDCCCLMVKQARLPLLDEPFAGVDPVNLQILASLIKRQARQEHAAVLLVSHEIPSVVEMADEVILMDAGRVVMRGLPTEVVRSESFKLVYLT